MSHNRYPGIDPYLVSQVRYHARQLRHHPALREMAITDLEQELMLGFLLQQDKYNPSLAGWKTFVDLILRRAKGQLIEQAVAKQRGYTIKHVPYGTVPEFPTDPMVACELQIELTRVANKLPTVLATLLIDLHTASLKGIARQRNVSYLKLYYRLTKLRTFLTKWGLKPN